MSGRQPASPTHTSSMASSMPTPPPTTLEISRMLVMPILLFALALSGLVVLVTVFMPSLSGDSDVDSAALHRIPRSLEDVHTLHRVLVRYADAHYVWVMGTFAYAYVLKQAFSIPGSVFLNILAGALLGFTRGALFVCVLTSIGASGCYWMSHLYGRALARRLFGDKLASFAVTVRRQSDDNNLFYFLLFLRIMPASPNWFLNLASPLVDVPFVQFAASIFFGLMPYNLICVHAGTVLESIHSLDDALSRRNMLQLAVLAVLALAPIVIKRLGASASSMSSMTVAAGKKKA